MKVKEAATSIRFALGKDSQLQRLLLPNSINFARTLGLSALLVVGFGCLAFAEVAVRSEPALATPDLYAVASLEILMSSSFCKPLLGVEM